MINGAQTELVSEARAVEAVDALAQEVPRTNLEQLTELVTQAAMVFYLVESPVNPGVQSHWDALHYIATSLSVGYANIFPVTAAGKAIGAVVMMIGPALSAKALEMPAANMLGVSTVDAPINSVT